MYKKIIFLLSIAAMLFVVACQPEVVSVSEDTLAMTAEDFETLDYRSIPPSYDMETSKPYIASTTEESAAKKKASSTCDIQGSITWNGFMTNVWVAIYANGSPAQVFLLGNGGNFTYTIDESLDYTIIVYPLGNVTNAGAVNLTVGTVGGTSHVYNFFGAGPHSTGVINFDCDEVSSSTCDVIGTINWTGFMSTAWVTVTENGAFSQNFSLTNGSSFTYSIDESSTYVFYVNPLGNVTGASVDFSVGPVNGQTTQFTFTPSGNTGNMTFTCP
ncbi:MAG: hypothetical protein AAF587_39555 [Bacteroidota bacterium]